MSAQILRLLATVASWVVLKNAIRLHAHGFFFSPYILRTPVFGYFLPTVLQVHLACYEHCVVLVDTSWQIKLIY